MPAHPGKRQPRVRAFTALLGATAAETARYLLAQFIREALLAFRRLRNSRGTSAPDDQALHDFRVALRRSRTVLRAYRSAFAGVLHDNTGERLREVARATSASRDVESQLEWLRAQKKLGKQQKDAASWLEKSLNARVEELRTGEAATVTASFAVLGAEIERALSRAPAGAGSAGATGSFAESLSRQAAKASRRLERSLQDVQSFADQNEAHRSRIAGKRLRYLLEPVEDADKHIASIVRDLRDLQDSMGAMRDAVRFHLELVALLGPVSVRDLDRGTIEPLSRSVRSGIASLAERLDALSRSEYNRIRRRWTQKGSAHFFARVRATIAMLDSVAALSHQSVEIERKYLLRGLPRRTSTAKRIEIEQGWVQGEKLQERLRRSRSGSRSKYYRTMKLGAGIRRVELEDVITRVVFARMWPLTEGRRVRKNRYEISDGGLTWEIDEFLDRKLFLAEVELPSADIEPPIPRWLKPYLVREVTGDPRYVNRNLAR